ncbi:MAG: UDP-N-acetylmuramate dehydrogenase [Thermoanaerobaculales bacterium]|jgi:UDP-N-acetylmuramate dehydrogenase|nr:UDP-N-acetylmuramate dehydrogenase [Thermoanaerobaculales bacterium]
MVTPRTDVPLAERTTLEVGGPAEHLVEVETVEALRDALGWAADRHLPVTVLGGGSNVVVGDDGLPGLTVVIAARGLEIERRNDRAVLTAAAGEPWDEVVAAAVAEGLAGIECLSGIPGLAGATPIQNVGAYGQEVAAVISEVRVLDRTTLEERRLTAADCGFGYRASRFRRPDNPFVVLSVSFELRPGGPPTLAYAQLAGLFPGPARPGLGEVRAGVLELRRGKSMVLDPDDPNRRSAGSFFTNPVVGRETAEAVTDAARALGVLDAGATMPMHEVGEGQVKLSAAWLIEHAGFPRGSVRGRVGLSSAHALALVNRGGATAAELVGLARDIRRGVRSHLGVDLTPEPVFLGFTTSDPTD